LPDYCVHRAVYEPSCLQLYAAGLIPPLKGVTV
jgi:hypothetical protein